MKAIQNIPSKIVDKTELLHMVYRWRLKGKKIAFTNGVFDILHEGHIASICEAASYADVLIVAINSDASVKRLKGPDRPVHNQDARALMLASMLMTDAIVVFEDDTPQGLIADILPDVLVKGGDYTIEQIAGAKEVLANGGEVKLAGIVEGVSTTNIIGKIRAGH